MNREFENEGTSEREIRIEIPVPDALSLRMFRILRKSEIAIGNGRVRPDSDKLNRRSFERFGFTVRNARVSNFQSIRIAVDVLRCCNATLFRRAGRVAFCSGKEEIARKGGFLNLAIEVLFTHRRGARIIYSRSEEGNVRRPRHQRAAAEMSMLTSLEDEGL